MAKKAAGKKSARAAARQAAVDEALNHPATPVTGDAAQHPPAGSEGMPVQAVIPPARQLHSQPIGQLDPEDLPGDPRPIDPRTAIRVQATGLVYYDNVLRRVGDVFDIRDEKEMSKAMRRVPKSTPTRITTPNQALASAKSGTDVNQGVDPAGGQGRATDSDVLG